MLKKIITYKKFFKRINIQKNYLISKIKKIKLNLNFTQLSTSPTNIV